MQRVRNSATALRECCSSRLRASVASLPATSRVTLAVSRAGSSESGSSQMARRHSWMDGSTSWSRRIRKVRGSGRQGRLFRSARNPHIARWNGQRLRRSETGASPQTREGLWRSARPVRVLPASPHPIHVCLGQRFRASAFAMRGGRAVGCGLRITTLFGLQNEATCL